MKTILDLLINQVHEIWGAGNYMMSLLTLNITRAYNRMVCRQLVHMLKTKKIPENMTNWVHLFMTDKIITLVIKDYKIEKASISAEISQRLLLFPILYLFYAAELLEAYNNTSERLSASGFIDDTNLLAYGPSTERNCSTLIRAHDKCLNWAKCYGAFFNLEKYELIHLLRTPHKFNMRAMLQMGNKILVFKLLI